MINILQLVPIITLRVTSLAIMLAVSLLSLNAYAQPDSFKLAEVDERTGTVLLKGKFSQVEEVNVDGMSIQILYSNDTAIACKLPSEGSGSAGTVSISTVNARLSRVLTRYVAELRVSIYSWSGQPRDYPTYGGSALLVAQWRVDLGADNTEVTCQPLERSSYVDLVDESYGTLGRVLLPWSDSLRDSSFTATLTVDRTKRRFGFDVHLKRDFKVSAFKDFQFSSGTSYDTKDYLKNFAETVEQKKDYGSFRVNSIELVSVQFPPVLPNLHVGSFASDVSWLAVPNPFMDQVSVEMNAPHPGIVRIELFDVLGRSVGQKIERYVEKGATSLKYPVAGLDPGSYLLRVEFDGWQVRTQRIEKR